MRLLGLIIAILLARARRNNSSRKARSRNSFVGLVVAIVLVGLLVAILLVGLYFSPGPTNTKQL